MATSRVRRQPSLPDDGPEFFKVFLPFTTSQHISIPPTFIKHFNGTIPNKAILIDHTGNSWPVGLEQIDSRLCIKDGWQRFASDRSLEFGDFIIFKYTKSCMFKVKIFSKTGCVKYEAEATGKTTPYVTLEEGSIAERVCGRLTRAGKRKLLEICLEKNEEAEQCPTYNVRRTPTMSVDERTRALRKARDFKPENPYFVAVMRPSYVVSTMYLNIPLSFAKSYLNKKVDDIILRVSDGRCWSVKYVFEMSATTSRGVFGCGWKVFARDNNLQVGDVCVFELIKAKGDIETSFQVVIFHASQELCPQSPGELKFAAKGESRHMPNSPTPRQNHHFKRQPWTARDKARALEKASSFKSENPFLMVAMCPSHVSNNCNLAVPGSFLKSRYIKGRRQIVMLRVGDESWPVTILTTNSRVTMSGGWSTFARDNKLQAGDVCVFELIKSDDDILKVSIFRCLS